MESIFRLAVIAESTELCEQFKLAYVQFNTSMFVSILTSTHINVIDWCGVILNTITSTNDGHTSDY